MEAFDIMLREYPRKPIADGRNERFDRVVEETISQKV